MAGNIAPVAPVPQSYGQGGGNTFSNNMKFGPEQVRDYSLGCFIVAGVTGLVSMLLLLFNFSFLKREEFQDLEAEDNFVGLAALSALIIPLAGIGGCCLATEASEGTKKCLVGIVAIYMATIGVLFFALLGPPVELAGVFSDVKNFENTQDEDVQFVLAGFLALFANCCFDPDNIEDVVPDLNCGTNGNVQPCFDDELVFNKFDQQINFTSSFCNEVLIPEQRESSRRRRGGSTSTGKVIREEVRFNSDEICDKGADGYVIDVSNVIQGTIIVNIVFVCIFGCCYTTCGSMMLCALCGCQSHQAPSTLSPEKYDPTPYGANNYGYNKDSVGTSAYGANTYQAQPNNDNLVVIQGTAI